jgi:hypothetical protein
MAVDYIHFGRTCYLHLQGGNEPSRRLYNSWGKEGHKERRVGQSARNREEEMALGEQWNP